MAVFVTGQVKVSLIFFSFKMFQDRLKSAHYFSSSSAASNRGRMLRGGGEGGEERLSSMEGGGGGIGSSVYASTIVSMELEDEEARRGRQGEALNDQQWVMQVRTLCPFSTPIGLT